MTLLKLEPQLGNLIQFLEMVREGDWDENSFGTHCYLDMRIALFGFVFCVEIRDIECICKLLLWNLTPRQCFSAMFI